MARPTLSTNERRSRHVIFRVTEIQYGTLQERAECVGLSINDFARQLVLLRESQIKIKSTRRFDPALINQLARVGNNLNQLTQIAHMTGDISPRLNIILDAIYDIVERARKEADNDS